MFLQYYLVIQKYNNYLSLYYIPLYVVALLLSSKYCFDIYLSWQSFYISLGSLQVLGFIVEV